MATTCEQVFNSEVLPDVEELVDAYIKGGGVSPVNLRAFLVEYAGEGIDQYLSDSVTHDLLRRASKRTTEAKAKKIAAAIKKHRDSIVPEQTKDYIERANKWVEERLSTNPKSARVRQSGLDVIEPKPAEPPRPNPFGPGDPKSVRVRQNPLDIEMPEPKAQPGPSGVNDAEWPPVTRDTRQLGIEGTTKTPLPEGSMPIDLGRKVEVNEDGRDAVQMELGISKKTRADDEAESGLLYSLLKKTVPESSSMTREEFNSNRGNPDSESGRVISRFLDGLKSELNTFLAGKYGSNSEVYASRSDSTIEDDWFEFLRRKKVENPEIESDWPPVQRDARQLGLEGTTNTPLPTSALPLPERGRMDIDADGKDAEQMPLGIIMGPEQASPLFVPNHVRGIAARLKKTYHPPTVKGRDPKTIDLLTQVGGYFFMKGHRDFYDWALHTTSAVGVRMHPADMVAAFQGIHPAAFKKVESNTAIVRAARKRAYASLSPGKMDAFLKDMANIDSTADDLSDQVNNILKKHRRIMPIDYLYEVPGLLRAVRTSWDASAPFRQASVLTIGGLANKQRRKIVLRAFGEMLASSSDRVIGVAKTLGIVGQNVESSEDFGLSVLREIESRENAKYYERFNLARSKVGGDTVDLTAREEAYMTNVVQLLRESEIRPLRKFAEGISASERMYSVYLNRLRADTFDLIAEQLIHDGVTPDVNPEVYEALAGWINDTTGRSTLPQLGRRREQGALFNAERDEATAGKLLSSIFFALRFQASRAKTIVAPIRLLSSATSTYAQQSALRAGKDRLAGGISQLSQIGHAADLPPELQGLVAQDLLRYYGVIGTVIIGSMLAGSQVETDRRSTDFLKIRRGNTRIDILGGNQQWVVLLARLARQETSRRSKSGNLKVSELNTGKYGSKTTTNVLSGFIRSKLAPIPSEALNIAEGRDLVGNMKWRYPSESGIVVAKYIAKDVFGSVSPMWAEDMYEAIVSDPEVTDVNSPSYYYRKMEAPMLSLLNLVGIGVQNYGDEPKDRRLE